LYSWFSFGILDVLKFIYHVLFFHDGTPKFLNFRY